MTKIFYLEILLNFTLLRNVSKNKVRFLKSLCLIILQLHLVRITLQKNNLDAIPSLLNGNFFDVDKRLRKYTLLE